MLRKNTEKYIAFSEPMKKNLIMVKQLRTKELLTALDMCQAHYQILLIIYLRDFIVINAL